MGSTRNQEVPPDIRRNHSQEFARDGITWLKTVDIARGYAPSGGVCILNQA
jgi:hypothetical protein